ncbi:trithorax group protein osa-like [Lytechinus pictus]|uniref:trithorax group protein osa-like n=1 Tax=Lytechinus pictus TaxID=7653 RepID=UPI0030BA26A8
MPEEEVVKRTLPDILVHNLDIVIIGINPGLMAAYKGHHYAGPGNHFWKCLYLSGLVPEPMTCMDDVKLPDFGVGFTNIVGRTTRGSADLKRKEIKDGAKIVVEKIQKYRPLIACFNGKGIYEIYSGKKDFEVGRQPETIPGTETVIYVMPSSSARCSQFPRAQDKVPFYITLKELRDKMKGTPLSEIRRPPIETMPPTPVKTKSKKKQQQQQQQQQQIQQQQQMQQQQPPPHPALPPPPPQVSHHPGVKSEPVDGSYHGGMGGCGFPGQPPVHGGVEIKREPGLDGPCMPSNPPPYYHHVSQPQPQLLPPPPPQQMSGSGGTGFTPLQRSENSFGVKQEAGDYTLCSSGWNSGQSMSVIKQEPMSHNYGQYDVQHVHNPSMLDLMDDFLDQIPCINNQGIPIGHRQLIGQGPAGPRGATPQQNQPYSNNMCRPPAPQQQQQRQPQQSPPIPPSQPPQPPASTASRSPQQKQQSQQPSIPQPAQHANIQLSSMQERSSPSNPMMPGYNQSSYQNMPAAGHQGYLQQEPNPGGGGTSNV